jgi:hypothetical protein
MVRLELPVLSLPDIYAALLYYLAYRDELRAYLNQRRAEAHEFQAANMARSGQGAVRERLIARLKHDEH